MKGVVVKMYKGVIIILIVFSVGFILASSSFAYIMGAERNSINLGVTLLGISLGAEYNITDTFYTGASLVGGGSLYGGVSSTSLYVGYYILKSNALSLSLSVEYLNVSQGVDFSALGGGINIWLPEANGREKKISIIPYIYKDVQGDSNTSLLSPSTGIQVSFPINENSKWYVSDRPFLSPQSPVAFFWGIILNI